MNIRFAALIHLGAAAGGLLNFFLPVFWNIWIPAFCLLCSASEESRRVARNAVRFQLRLSACMVVLLAVCVAGMWSFRMGIMVDDNMGRAVVHVSFSRGFLFVAMLLLGEPLLGAVSILVPLLAAIRIWWRSWHAHPAISFALPRLRLRHQHQPSRQLPS